MFVAIATPIATGAFLTVFMPLVTMMYLSDDPFLTCLIALAIFSFISFLSGFGVYEGILLLHSHMNKIEEEKKELLFVLFISTIAASLLVVIVTMIMCCIREYNVRRYERQIGL